MKTQIQSEEAQKLASTINSNRLKVNSLDASHKLQILFQAFLLSDQANDLKKREEVSFLFFWITTPIIEGEFDLDSIALQISVEHTENLKTLMDCFWLSDFADDTRRKDRIAYKELITTLSGIFEDMIKYNLIRK